MSGNDTHEPLTVTTRPKAIVKTLFVLVISAVAAQAAEPVKVTIENLAPQIQAGSSPSFRVTLTNSSSDSVKVIAAADQSQFQRWQFLPTVRKHGKEVWLPQGCDLPLPPSDDDYVTLHSGESYSFTLANFTGHFEELPTGWYQVLVTYRHWRYREQSYTSASNVVSLKIVE